MRPDAGLCTQRTAGTAGAVSRVEFDMDHVFAVPIMRPDPVATRLANRTGDRLRLPINRKPGLVEALLLAALPTGILSNWPDEGDVLLLCAH